MGRLIREEAVALSHSLIVWLAVSLVVGGSILARMLAWISNALGRSGLGGLPVIGGRVGWSDVAIPLALLAYLILTAYVFGRDFEDGTIDLVLTSPVRRDAVVVAWTVVVAGAVFALGALGWGADVVTCGLLGSSSFDPGSAIPLAVALGSTIAAIATLPLVAWASIRFRGVLPALGLGFAVQVGVLALGRIAFVRTLPWFLPTTLAAGASASWISIVLSILLFVGGLAATFRGLRTVDLYE